MALINKKRDMTPYDMRRSPRKASPFLLPVMWGASFIMTRQFGLKIEKVNMDGLKPPFLVLGTHQGFSDYYIGPLSVFPHRAMYVSDMEGFAVFGNWLYRAIGCIGKRRYVADINVMRHIKNSLKSGQSVFIYPESRHSNIGITSKIPANMGRLVKNLNVPLVILSASGSYLANPFWNEEKTRKVPIKAKMEHINTEGLDANQIQAIIEEKLSYDEYDYQHQEGFLIKDKDRAEGIHKALYQCINCRTKYQMSSSGTTLKCNSCGKSWSLTEDGWLSEGDKKIHIPDWYKSQIPDAVSAVDSAFIRKFKVKVEALPNEKGFIDFGSGDLELNSKEFILDFSEGRLVFPHKNRESVQTEYNYRNKGKAIVLSTKDCCYYLYSEDEDFEPTEIQFIGEYLYDSYSKA